MSNGYVGIGYGEEGSTQQVPDEVKAEVETLAAKIVSGESRSIPQEDNFRKHKMAWR